MLLAAFEAPLQQMPKADRVGPRTPLRVTKASSRAAVPFLTKLVR
jgi:hypothetical protein